MDFVHGQLADGSNIRPVNVGDEFSRQGLAIEVDLHLPVERVTRALNKRIEWRGAPLRIGCEYGPEYAGHTFYA